MTTSKQTRVQGTNCAPLTPRAAIGNRPDATPDIAIDTDHLQSHPALFYNLGEL